MTSKRHEPSTSIQKALELEMTMDQISGLIPIAPKKVVTLQSIIGYSTHVFVIGFMFVTLCYAWIHSLFLGTNVIPDLLAEPTVFANWGGLVATLLMFGMGSFFGFIIGSMLLKLVREWRTHLWNLNDSKPVSFQLQDRALRLGGDIIPWSQIDPSTTSVIRFAEHVELRLGFRDGTEQTMKCPLKSQRAVDWLSQVILERTHSFGTEDDVPESIQALRSTPKQPV